MILDLQEQIMVSYIFLILSLHDKKTMKLQTHQIFRFFIIALIVSNCNVARTWDSSKEAPFELLYPNCMMNSAIRFLPLQENHKFGNNIILNYKNYSQDQIAFPFSVGVKIFTYNQNDLKWVEVKNNMQYSVSPGPYHFVGPTDEESSYDGIVISPDTSDDQTLEMRVTIAGYVYRDGIVTDECVGAFMDIQT